MTEQFRHARLNGGNSDKRQVKVIVAQVTPCVSLFQTYMRMYTKSNAYTL